MSEVFKLQRTTRTTEAVPQVLCYNEDRSVEGQFPINDELAKLFGDEYKIYVEGEIGEDGRLMIDSVVEDQPW